MYDLLKSSNWLVVLQELTSWAVQKQSSRCSRSIIIIKDKRNFSKLKNFRNLN